MTAPRVIHLDDGREWRGGQHQVFLLAEGLARLGIRQRVVTPERSPLGERLAAAGVEVVSFNFRGEWDWRAPRFLERLAIATGSNIIHAHTAHAHTLGLRAHKRLRRAERDAQLVITRRVDFAVGRGWFSRRKYTYPHQNYIAISQAVRDVLIAGGVEAKRIDLVHSGVPPIPEDLMASREDVRRNFGLTDNERAIVNVGALTDHKGQKYLIEAAKFVVRAVPSAKFIIIGDGELREELAALIAKLDLKNNVQLAGHVPNARLSLSGFDYYVSSSHLEGLGTSILDAMLAELPVIAYAAGGITDFVQEGSGILAKPKDPEDLGRAIVKALNMPSDELRLMIETARKNIEEKFSSEQMVKGTLQVYQKLLADNL